MSIRPLVRAMANDLRLGESLLGSLRSASRFLVFQDPRFCEDAAWNPRR